MVNNIQQQMKNFMKVMESIKKTFKMLGLENTKSEVENLSHGINNGLDTVQETVQDEDRVL